ncbi:MAG: hypothetical protein ACYDH5_15200, partial [Acidimicrobiales bacterium]
MRGERLAVAAGPGAAAGPTLSAGAGAGPALSAGAGATPATGAAPADHYAPAPGAAPADHYATCTPDSLERSIADVFGAASVLLTQV